MSQSSPDRASEPRTASSSPTAGATTQQGLDTQRQRLHDEHERELAERRRDEFGGVNAGAAFFGWLVAVAIAILIAGVFGAIAAAVGSTTSVSQNQAERSAGTIGIVTAIALLVTLMIGYYAGGYVAGRMSRFDGGRQGAAVWLIGIVVTIMVVVIGAVFGNQYDIFARVDLPSLPIPTDAATIGGLITLAAVILGTLLAAFAGGKAGQRYHRRIDRISV
jgi:hypothetical protein